MRKRKRTLVKLCVVAHKRPQLSGGKGFAGHQRHRRNHAERAKLLSFVIPALRVGNVFNDGNAVTVGNFHDAVHVGGMRKIVNDHDRSRARGNTAFEVIGVNAQRFVNVRKYNGGTHRLRGGAGCPVGLRRADELIPRTKPDGKHRRLQSHRAVAVGKTVPPFLPCGKFILELFGDVRSRHRIAVQNVKHGILVFFRNDRPVEKFVRQGHIQHFWPAEQGKFGHGTVSFQSIARILWL